MKKHILTLLLALVLCMGLCVPASAAATPFTDVPAGSPFEEAIAFAVEVGIAKGTSATTFSPNNPCTVSHILTFLMRSLGGGSQDAAAEREDVRKMAVSMRDNYGVPIDPENLNAVCTRLTAVRIFAALSNTYNEEYDAKSAQKFTDLPDDKASRIAVAMAVDFGITKGTSETAFSPDNPCTRGQIITFIYRSVTS